MSYTVGSTRVINTTSASGTTDFTFTFPYIKEAHIEVYNNYTKLNQGTTAGEYQVITNVSPKLIRLGTGIPSANVRIEIRRNSSLDSPLVDYADGATLTANDLDTSALQSLYIDQELKDSQYQTVSISATTGLPTLGTNPLTEVANPTNAQDAATKSYVDSNIDTKIDSALTDDIAAGSSISITDNSPSSGKVTLNVIAATGSNSGSLSASDKSKLDGIDTGAKDDQTAAEIRVLVESATDSNVFTDNDHSRLNAMEDNATADQTGAEIKAAYEAESNTNAYTDAEKSKLAAIDTGAKDDQTASEIKTLLQSNKLTNSEIATGALDNQYYTETELDAGQLDNRYYTETESDARYFNISTGDTIKDGDTFPDNDTTIATTAAINDRIIDLVDDVGGFVPLVNEAAFPATNPDVNNGAGTIVSIGVLSASYTPSGGTATIPDSTLTNISGSNVTITDCGTTVLAAGYGVLVETTSTLHTYKFHRLTPKATEVTTVAGNNSNISTVAGNNTNINTVAGIDSNITTVAGIHANVTTVAGISSNVTSVAGNSTNINAVNSNATNINTVAGAITNVNTVGGSISNVNTVATNISSVNDFAARYRIASSDPSSNNDTGDLVFNTTSNELRVYNGSTWQGGVTATGNLLSKSGDQMTGNLTFSGSQTVDGRDVSVDGAKLDGIAANANNYTHPNHTGEVTSSADGATVVVDNIIDEANLKVSNSPTNGQFLSAQSGNTGGLTWATPANTTYTVGDGGLTQKNFTTTLKTKLDGIATNANNYTHPNHSGEVTSSADGAQTIASNVVDEDNLKISNSGSNGQFLQKQSGNTGGLTWADVDLTPYAPKASPAFTGTATGANLTLSGNLTVNGTTTTVATTNTTLTDNLLELNSGASSNANDAGILIERGSTGDNAIIAWDESADKFTVGTTTGTASSTGNISITTGTLVANVEGNLSGNGSGITTINASNISSGTVPVARLGSGASNSKFLRGDNTWQDIDLTSLSASNLTSGTVPMARLGTAGTPSASTCLRGDGYWSTIDTTYIHQTNSSGNYHITFASGNGNQYLHKDDDGSFYYQLQSNKLVCGNFQGNGSNLTSLNASNLGSGTIPDARFPSTLPAVSGANLTNIEAGSTIQGTASGSLTANRAVMVKSDGTLEQPTAIAAAVTSGTNVVSSSYYVGNTSRFIYDSVRNKVILIWDEPYPNYRGRYRVGNISGNSISWGSVQSIPGLSSLQGNGVMAAYDYPTGKVIITFTATYPMVQAGEPVTSGYVYTKVGSVSGTSISWGSYILFASQYSLGIRSDHNYIYEPYTGKILMIYKSGNNVKSATFTVSTSSNTGTWATNSFVMNMNASSFALTSLRDGRVILTFTDYTVGGSSGYRQRMKFMNWNTSGNGYFDVGSDITPQSSSPRYNHGPVAWHNDNGTYTIFAANGYSSNMYLQVGTLSGSGTSTSISWGSETSPMSSGFNTFLLDYNSVSKKLLLIGTHSNALKRREGTYSGTSMTWDSEVTDISSGAPNNFGQRMAYETLPNGGNKDGKYIIGYKDSGGNNGQGYYYIRQMASTTRDASRYIGMAKQSYSNGQTATVNVIGNSTTGSSLTPNSTYYIADDGSITGTETDLSIGKAYSSTKILLNR